MAQQKIRVRICLTQNDQRIRWSFLVLWTRRYGFAEQLLPVIKKLQCALEVGQSESFLHSPHLSPPGWDTQYGASVHTLRAGECLR